MRTTIDLPDDLYLQAQSLARDMSRTLSDVVAELMRRGLGQVTLAEISRSERTGLPVMRLGKVITSLDVQPPEDDSQ